MAMASHCISNTDAYLSTTASWCVYIVVQPYSYALRGRSHLATHHCLQDMALEQLHIPGCCRVEQHSEPHALLDNTVYISGIIPRLVQYEQGLPSHRTMWHAGGEYEPDPLLMEERCVVVKVSVTAQKRTCMVAGSHLHQPGTVRMPAAYVLCNEHRVASL
jgi:hypothetical protein